jgi:hypothetical protein
MCTRARPYGRAGRCGFGGRGVTDWSRNVLGDLEKRIKHAKKALELCRRRSLSQDSITRKEGLKYKLERLEEQRELYWRQRAKVHWLKNGDRNTKFFISVLQTEGE